MKLGLCQMSVTENLSTNTGKIIEFIEESASQNIDIVAFPEMSMTGYDPELLTDRNLNLKVAKAVKEIKDVVDSVGVAAIIGHPCKQGEWLYNRASAIMPCVSSISTCDKMHPVEAEQKYFKAGNEPLLISFKQSKIGVTICRDQNYPEIAKGLVEKGAEFIYIISAHYYSPKTARWKLEKNRAIPITRAVENRVHVLLSNTVGSHLGMISLGNSLIVDPDGAVVVSAGEAEEVILSLSTDDLADMINNDRQNNTL